MRRYTINDDQNQVIARDKTVWMGIDIHHKNAGVLILDEEQLIYSNKIPVGKEHFEALARRLPGCYVKAVYEAGCVGYRPLRWLTAAGFDAMMTAPAMVPKRDGEYVKTDRRDSLKLARALRGKMLDPVWDLTDEQYEHRQLVRTRKQLVGDRSRICQRIKSTLMFHRVERPDDLEANWSNDYLEWLEGEPSGRPSIDICVRSLVRMYRELSKEIRDLEREIKELVAKEPYREDIVLLRTAPGVGPIVAATFLLELQDMERFDTGEDFVGYLGLAPSEHSSDERKRKGGLPRKGNKHVRTALVQAAWVAIGKDARLRDVYDRIKRKNPQHGSQIAIVAVARRLALALRAMLRDRTPYQQG